MLVRIGGYLIRSQSQVWSPLFSGWPAEAAQEKHLLQVQVQVDVPTHRDGEECWFLLTLYMPPSPPIPYRMHFLSTPCNYLQSDPHDKLYKHTEKWFHSSTQQLAQAKESWGRWGHLPPFLCSNGGMAPMQSYQLVCVLNLGRAHCVSCYTYVYGLQYCPPHQPQPYSPPFILACMCTNFGGSRGLIVLAAIYRYVRIWVTVLPPALALALQPSIHTSLHVY